MSVKFFLANPKQDRTSIDVIVRMDGIRLKRGIGISVDTLMWNKDRQLASVTQKYREGGLVNQKVGEWKGAIERVIFRIKSDKLEFANDTFWKMVDCEIKGVEYRSAPQIGFVNYLKNKFIPRNIPIKSFTRIQRFRVILTILKEYETANGVTLQFDDIGMNFYRDFEAYIIGKKYSTNYYGTIVKIIKQIMREAMDADKLHNNTEFLSPRFKAPSREVDNIYLTTEELIRIHETPIDDRFLDVFYPRSTAFKRESIKKSYNVAKNRFLIGAFTGMRVSDFNALRSENFQGGVIRYVAKKTNIPAVVPIHHVVRDIIDSGFDLTLSLSEQKTRDYIKDICRYCKIDELIDVRDSTYGEKGVARYPKWELVGTHTARRSFATNAILSGAMSTVAIMRITGHTTEKMLMNYVKLTKEQNAEMLLDNPYFTGK